ncbi:MAG: hypothetical protein BMS9Abin07_2123 [Acidimicrobiia bacterium]|nr:MAG: hypothetical protein BMS9Abin07_2123 [Acidimicrobiia bacterium]
MTGQDSSTVDQDEANRWDWLNTEIDGKTVRFWIIVAVLITTVVLSFGAWWTYGWNHDPATTAALAFVPGVPFWEW